MPVLPARAQVCHLEVGGTRDHCFPHCCPRSDAAWNACAWLPCPTWSWQAHPTDPWWNPLKSLPDHILCLFPSLLHHKYLLIHSGSIYGVPAKCSALGTPTATAPAVLWGRETLNKSMHNYNCDKSIKRLGLIRGHQGGLRGEAVRRD